MKRFVIAITFAALFIFTGWIADLSHNAELQPAVQSIEQAHHTEDDRQMLKEYGNDIFRTINEGQNIFQTVRNQHSQSNNRLRHCHTTKSNLHASTCHFEGHATEIFGFTPNVSSQGNEYYLHTLCRLRI